MNRVPSATPAECDIAEVAAPSPRLAKTSVAAARIALRLSSLLGRAIAHDHNGRVYTQLSIKQENSKKAASAVSKLPSLAARSIASCGPLQKQLLQILEKRIAFDKSDPYHSPS